MKTSVRMNEEEKLVHDWLKTFFHYEGCHGEDSQTFKQAERFAFNVLRGLFSSDLGDVFSRLSRDELIKIRAVQVDRIKRKLKKAGHQAEQKLHIVGQGAVNDFQLFNKED